MAKARISSQQSMYLKRIVGIRKGCSSKIHLGYKIKIEQTLKPKVHIYSISNVGTKLTGFKTVRQAVNFIETLC